MASRRIALEDVQVASPCSVAWESMHGTERVRYCGECRLSVYNLSAMSRAEAEEFLALSTGRTCVRLYRRADGTVLTEDCPRGLARLGKAARRGAGMVLAKVFALLYVLAWLVGLALGEKGRSAARRHLAQVEPFRTALSWVPSGTCGTPPGPPPAVTPPAPPPAPVIMGKMREPRAGVGEPDPGPDEDED